MGSCKKSAFIFHFRMKDALVKNDSLEKHLECHKFRNKLYPVDTNYRCSNNILTTTTMGSNSRISIFTIYYPIPHYPEWTNINKSHGSVYQVQSCLGR